MRSPVIVGALLVAGCVGPRSEGEDLRGGTAAPDSGAAHTGDTDRDTDRDTADTDSGDADSGDSADTDTGGWEPVEGAALRFRGLPPRNLLVLSIDTLRRKDVGRYSGKDTTTLLDALAADGVALDDHVACSSWTLPGVLCAMSGRHPEEFGFAPRIQSLDAPVPVPAGTPFLPLWLGERGFSSWLVASNGYFSAGDGTNVAAQFDWAEVRSGLPADGVLDYALPILDTPEFTAADRWYLHLHFLDPHAPYAPPEGYLTALEGRPTLDWDLGTEAGTRALASGWSGLDAATKAEALAQLEIRYDGELRFLDAELTRLWGELEARGLLEDTLVLIWSDHGEQFFEHGSIGHAGDIYDETTDAIAFFWARNLAPAAWTEPTGHPDLAPTVLEALGLTSPAEPTGLVAGLALPARPRFNTLVPASGAPTQSVQVGDRRLIYSWDGTRRLMARGDTVREAPLAYDPADPRVIALWDLLAPEVARLATLVPDHTPVDAAP